jgi:hydroxyacylglutathione hydrolase
VDNLRVETVPYGTDNYCYLLITPGAVALVDCGEAEPVLARLKSLGRRLDAVFICHTHYDHTAGLLALIEVCPDLSVFASTMDVTTGVKHTRHITVVTDGMEVKVGGGTDAFIVSALSVPAHTSSCFNYYSGGALFTSDTLFSAGCGRLFEGSPENLLSAMDRLSAYPPGTRVYFGHEYTESNLRFALYVEPDNTDIIEYIKEIALNARGEVTTPSTIEREIMVNPFFRIDSEAVVAFVDPEGRHTRAERMGLLRRAKDRF